MMKSMYMHIAIIILVETLVVCQSGLIRLPSQNNYLMSPRYKFARDGESENLSARSEVWQELMNSQEDLHLLICRKFVAIY